MSKREQVQQEALDIALKHKRCGLGISMGVGKTLIGLQYLKTLWDNSVDGVRILVVAPKLSIFQSWKDDAAKFEIYPALMDTIQYTTYLSLNKYDPNDYDVVVFDECHSLLPTHLIFLGHYTGKILGLTGTPPRFYHSEKGQMVHNFCPILYKYITDEAVEDDILNDYRILVHRMPLSTANNIEVKLKDRSFYTSERKNYEYWTSRLMDAQTKKQEQIASVMRMRTLMEFKTKEAYAKTLLSEIDDKCIVFCNTQEQADRMCEFSYHSKNEESEENLKLFSEGDISELSCVLQLNEGINIKNLGAGIILHAYGNERKSSQRIGRLLRLNPDDTAFVHILCYTNTVDEKWVTEALKDFDQSKIKYFDVNISSYEPLYR
jgi:superfamily II DNA or RNA helicase